MNWNGACESSFNVTITNQIPSNSFPSDMLNDNPEKSGAIGLY